MSAVLDFPVSALAPIRTWPTCQGAMRQIIGHLASLGATQEEIVACLRRDFPDLPVAEGPAWRRDAYYQNVVATELVRLAKRPGLRQQPDPPDDTSDPARIQAAEHVLAELHVRGAGARRNGERVQIYRLDPTTTQQLSEELKAAIAEYAEEIWELVGSGPAAPASVPAPTPPRMGQRLLSFAEVRGYRCAYCGRVGGRAGDPDGRAWHEDSAPGGGYLLSCTACVAWPDRTPRRAEEEENDGI